WHPFLLQLSLAFAVPVDLRELSEPDGVPPRLAHVNLGAAGEGVVAGFDNGDIVQRLLDGVEIGYRDEERDRMAHQLARRRWLLTQHARASLVHDLDRSELDAGENQLAVVVGHLVGQLEAEPVGPELHARLYFV